MGCRKCAETNWDVADRAKESCGGEVVIWVWSWVISVCGSTKWLFIPWQPDSEVAEAGRCLDEFFEDKLREIYPDRHFPSMQQDDSDSEDVESHNSQVPSQDFQWPSYGQECVQPKRKRRHAVRLQKQKHLVAKWPPC